MKNKNINEIKNELDKWVKGKGELPYVNDSDVIISSTLENFQLCPTNGIQQNKDEILQFVDLLFGLNNHKIALEIGLGFYGSTHFLWRHIFDKVLTIECDWGRIREFGRNTFDYYGEWVLKEKSYFIHSKSYEPKAVESVRNILSGDKLDLLFIDSYHDYKSVLTDFLLYKDLVRSGGIIAFHDILYKRHNGELPKFVEDLSEGKIDGRTYKVNKIVHSKHLGIGWIGV